MKTKWVILAMALGLPSFPSHAVDTTALLFYESFDSVDAIQANGGGAGTTGWPEFSSGVVEESADFSGSKIVCYPLNGYFPIDGGTIEFWVKPPDGNSFGFFDIGQLGRANSWGIFKNIDHFIMEVKNAENRYDQARSPSPVAFDDNWHLITAVWDREEETTLFKICVDGSCKEGYDGSIDNSHPDLSGDFCVGWSGWYGYSESVIDEFRIWGYAKSDTEIEADFSSPGRDTVRPAITLNGNDTVVVGVGSSYIEPGANAIDDRDGDISHNILFRGAVDTSREGAYRLSYNVSDASGNRAREAVRTVYVVDLEVDPVERAFEYLTDRMDQFNTRFDIYTDFVSGGSHGTPSGWMGDYDILMVDPAWDANCHGGFSCFKNIWETNEPGWVGIRWLQPDSNWGTVPDAGYDLTGATTLSFYARGAEGNEPVEFVAGGVLGPNPDSIQPAVSSGVITLSSEWERYDIDLTGIDLSNVISPFGWVVRNDPVFFIDDVTYDLPRPDSLRFIQSFEVQNPDEELALINVAYVYDNALALLAYLARGGADDIHRAGILADTILFVLENDRAYRDGRIRNGYMSGDISDPGLGEARLPGWWDSSSRSWFEDEFNVSTHTGNVAWAMLALLSYYESQGGDEYLQAAAKMGDWVGEELWDGRGSGGFTGGFQGWEVSATNTEEPRPLLYKATEHNIDLYPAFMRLYALTHQAKWLDRAEYAKGFVDSMWNSSAGHFWTGTTEDGETVNSSNVPVDIQAWAVMAMPGEIRYRSALDWADNNCAGMGDGFEGFDFNCGDNDGVWFEGTAQMALGFQIDDQGIKSDTNLGELRRAQTDAQNANGKAIVAASHDGVTTGFDWEYFARRHVGATSWYLLAELGSNPYWGTRTPAIPVIKANGKTQATTVGGQGRLSISVDLVAATGLGTLADWWLVMSAPDGSWLNYRYPGQWTDSGYQVTALAPALQYPLVEIHDLEVLNISGLSPGLYTFYFGVDLVADGELNVEGLYVDRVEVTVAR